MADGSNDIHLAQSWIAYEIVTFYSSIANVKDVEKIFSSTANA
jgi:hypothetical protein